MKSKQDAQIKSKKRVRDFAEVFTNKREVISMCDIIPKDVWDNIDSKFLEPACGNGNFIEEILNRKLSLCKTPNDIIRALKSIYAIDIQPDNVVECKQRMTRICFEKYHKMIPCINPPDEFACEIVAVLTINVVCGDSLEIMKELEDREWEETTAVKESIAKLRLLMGVYDNYGY